MALAEAIRSTSIGAMFKDNNLKQNDFTLVKQTFDVDKFINGEVDAMSVFVSNQLYILDKLNIKYNIFNPSDYGIYSYDEELFTSKSFVDSNPELVQRFIQATHKGWQYSFEHKEEIVDLIYEKYSQKKSKEALLYEANKTEKLFKLDTFTIGSVVTELVELNAVVYKKLGLVKQDVNLKNILSDYTFNTKTPSKNKEFLTPQERLFLNKHPLLKMHMESNYMPFSNLENNNKYIGYSIEYADIIAKKLGITFTYNKNENWHEAIDRFKSKKIDIIAQMVNTQERQKFTLFSDNYMNYYLGIVIKKSNSHLNSIKKLAFKKVGVVKGYYAESQIKKYYPDVEVVSYNTSKEILKNIRLGTIDAGIDTHNVMQFDINSLFFSELTSIPILDNKHLPKIQEAFGVRKDLPLLHSALQKALKSIDTNTITALKLKWFGHKSLDVVQQNILFTKKELDFLNKNLVLKVGNDKFWPPFDFYEHSKAKGFNVDYLKEIGFKIEI